MNSRIRLSGRTVLCCATLFVAVPTASAEPSYGNRPYAPYQRRATTYDQAWKFPPKRARFRHAPPRSSSVQSGSFQRPYPYHLDYYKMRFGGSYAPYFGFLYGTPKVYAPFYGNGGFAVPGYPGGGFLPGAFGGGYPGGAPGYGWSDPQAAPWGAPPAAGAPQWQAPVDSEPPHSAYGRDPGPDPETAGPLTTP